MASASVLFSTLSIPISREKTNPTISSRIRCCEDTLRNPNLKLIDTFNGKGMDRFLEKLSVARVGSCPRLRRIILVRHGQSEGNMDESVYTMVSDPKIRLTQKGWHEAEGCGKMIRDMIELDGVDDWKVYFVF